MSDGRRDPRNELRAQQDLQDLVLVSPKIPAPIEVGREVQ